MRRSLLSSLVLLFVVFAAAAGGVDPTSEGLRLSERRLLYEGEGGVNCEFFMAEVLRWEHRGGDWLDARGKRFGPQPFAEASTGAADAVLDLTPLVRRWLREHVTVGQLFIRSLSGRGVALFHSRQAGDLAQRPLLALEYGDGHKDLLNPSADTHTECSTYKSSGLSPTLSLSDQHNILLQFKLPASGQALTRARLLLSGAGRHGEALHMGVFETAVPEFLSAPPPPAGLAAALVADAGLARHPDVLFFTGFEEPLTWRQAWARGANGEIDRVDREDATGFRPLSGAALRVNLKQGSNMGADLRVALRDHGGEPDELFLRYYLRLGDDWHPSVDGGKLPGLAGTYGEAGWGGRRADGSNGWSLRGAFLRAFPADHPLAGLTQLATYAYHADMAGVNGEHWLWSGALLQRRRWYCIEQQVQLNHIDRADGRVRAWVDGRLVLDRGGVRLRRNDRLHIETAWMNVFHGGSAVSPHDQHLYIDNVVLARRYIGPMGAAPLEVAKGIARP